jgi:RNA polymerase-binding transcription factor DksA
MAGWQAWQAGAHGRLDIVTESGTSWPDAGSGTADKDGPDRGARPTEAADDEGLAVLEQIERELAEVDGALLRLDDGTYGTCRVCAAPIDDQVLAERPTADVCGEHASSPGS